MRQYYFIPYRILLEKIKKSDIMKDFKAISHTVGNEIKQKIFGKSDYGNDDWKKANFEWYEKIHDENSSLHNSFMKYFDNKKNSIKTVLEVGCGAGIYPIKYKKIFEGLQYTGIDFSETNIGYCKKQSHMILMFSYVTYWDHVKNMHTLMRIEDFFQI